MSGYRASDKDDWREYVEAVQRKVKIARHHLTCLEKEVACFGEVQEDPPIPMQASFEGVLYAYIAGADQLGEALIRGFQLTGTWQKRETVLDRAIRWTPASPLRDQVREWSEGPILKDARKIRRLATHHHYAKAGPGRVRFVVQVPPSGRPYGGSRDLAEYGKAVVEHADGLLPLLGELKRVLSR